MNLLAFYRESIKALFIRTREVGYYFAVNCENYLKTKKIFVSLATWEYLSSVFALRNCENILVVIEL